MQYAQLESQPVWILRKARVSVEMVEELSFETGVVGVGRYTDDRPRRGGLVHAPRRPQRLVLPEMVHQVRLVDIAQHQVYPGDGGDRVRIDLCVAAGDRHHAARVQAFRRSDLAPAGAIALGRHSAGVYDSEIGGLVPIHELVARSGQQLLHLGGLTVIELAADSPEGDPGRRRSMGVGSRHHRPMVASRTRFSGPLED